MKKKSNLRKLIDKKTKYQKKYNNFSKISWVQKIMLWLRLRKIRKTIDLTISSYARYDDLLPKDIIANEKNILKRFILKILIKIFKIQIKRLYGYKENRENARQALYHIAKNIQYNKVILEKKAKKDRSTKLFNDLNSVIVKHYSKSEKDLTKMLLELEKENKYLNSKINSITQQKEYIGKQDSAFRVESKLISSDDVTDEWVKRLKKSTVNNIKPVDLFYKQPDDITYMKHD